MLRVLATLDVFAWRLGRALHNGVYLMLVTPVLLLRAAEARA